jgi:hypothetical protein
VSVGERLAGDLRAESVLEEVEHIHVVCMEGFRVLSPGPGEPSLYLEAWTWANWVECQGFHIAYHAGPMHAVGHLLGNETVDNER